MAKVEFDEYGNPKPYDFIDLTLEEFKEIFVESFNPKERREQLFNKYIEYIKDFYQIYRKGWEQWLDGSYTTRKENPNDIDGVGLIDIEFVMQHQEQIKKFFRAKMPHIRDVMDEYGLDIYLVFVYPKDDERYKKITLNQIEYWKEWFSKDRQGRPKGIIKIMVNANEL